MQTTNWDDFTPVGAPPAAAAALDTNWDDFQPIRQASAMGKLMDIGTSFARGAVGSTKAIADAGGAGSAPSRMLAGTGEAVEAWLSPARQAEVAARQRTIRAAEQSGSGWEEAKAHLGGFLEAPVSATAEALGSTAPVVGAMLAPGLRGNAARILTGTALGAAQGAGSVKGAIHDAVEQKHLERGADPAQASAAADAAQAYSGPNVGSIATGAGLGVAAARLGVEGAIGRMVGGHAAAGGASVARRALLGAVGEGLPEAAQGGQERLAANLAVQGEGFDVPTWQGVVGQATGEGVAGGAAGAGVGAMSRGHARGPIGRAAEGALQQQAAQTAAQEPVSTVPPVVESMVPGPGWLHAFAEQRRRDAPSPETEEQLARLPEELEVAEAFFRSGRWNEVKRTLQRADETDIDLAFGTLLTSNPSVSPQRRLAALASVQSALGSELAAFRGDAAVELAGAPDLAAQVESLPEGAQTHARTLLREIESGELPAGVLAFRLNELKEIVASQFETDSPVSLVAAQDLRRRASEIGVDAQVRPDASGVGYTVSRTVADGGAEAAVAPEGSNLLTYDQQPTGRMLAGEEGVRVETRADAINRGQQAHAERLARDTDRQRRVDLGMPLSREAGASVPAAKTAPQGTGRPRSGGGAAQVQPRPEAATSAVPTGTFSTWEQARAYVSKQRRSGGARIQALPLPMRDGTFGLAVAGTPEFTIAQFHKRQREQRAQGVLDGDILNPAGEPFAGAPAAGVALRKVGPGHEIVRLAARRFVIRKIADARSDDTVTPSAAQLNAFTAPESAGSAVQADVDGAIAVAIPARPDAGSVSPAPVPAITRAELAQMAPDQVERAHEDAMAHNDAIDIAAARQLRGDAFATEFQQWSRRKRERWMQENLTVEQDDALQAAYQDEELIKEYRGAAGDFDESSPAALGRSIMARVKDMRKPGWEQTPAGVTVREALNYATEKGWSEAVVLNGVRARIVQVYGDDAAEIFPKFFQPKKERAPTQERLALKRDEASDTDSRGAALADSDRRMVEIEMMVDEVTADWARKPDVVVVRHLFDPRLPAAVLEDVKASFARGDTTTGAPQGVYYRGQIFLIAQTIKDVADARKVLMHEALGHWGLRGVFGKALDQVLKDIVAVRRAEVVAKAKAYGFDPTSDEDLRAAAEELLADLAQTRPEIGFVRRAAAAIRAWLRKHVPGFKSLRTTNDEIIRQFILPARGWVERGGHTRSGGSRALGTAPAFSRTVEQGARESGSVVTDLKRRLGNVLADYRGLALSALGRRQLNEIYGKDLPQLTEYSKLVQQMDADKNEAGAEADNLATRWGKLKDERELAELMHDATLAQIDPDKPFVEGDDENFYEALKHGFDSLSDDAKKVYREARDTYRTHHENVRKALRDRIERSEIRGERKAALLKQMDDEFFKAIKGVYFPLSRFGQYVVVVRDGTGKAINVSRAETLNEAEAVQRALRKAYPNDTVGKVLKAKEFNAGRDAVGRGFMDSLFEALGKREMDEKQRIELEDMLGQLYLSALPDLSWAKHGIHRKGTPGFSQDARRAFAQNVFHGARYLAKVRYSDLLENELSAMQKHVDSLASTPGFDNVRAQQVIDEMVKRHDAMMSPTGNALSTALTSLGFVFHLGLSPASAMVNLSQTALVAYPIMGARWGFGKASAALLKASQQAAAAKNDISGALSPDERRAYDEAVRSGVIDVTMAHDLAGISQGEDAKVSWKLRPVMKWASFLFHHAEKFNRQVTFVAAYRLARDAGAKHTEAYDQAVKATYDGHFDYSSSNRPRLMQGNVAKVVLLFKQYGQNMVYTLSRQAYQAVKAATPAERAEARKALGGLLAMHGAAAGALGLPMVTTLLAAASMVGGSDDEPWDAEVALRNMLADAVGPKASEVLTRGLSRLTPWDISGRVGLDKLILPDLQEGLEGQRLGESAMAAALGPVAGISISALKGLQSIADGSWARGLEEMAPSVLRGPLKAARFGTEGAIDKTGKPIVPEVSAAGVAGQALGFSPSEVRQASEAKSAILDQDRRLRERRSALMRHYAMAVIAEDQEGVQEAREAIQGFNEKQPGRQINALQMAQSVRARRRQIAEAEQGVYLPRTRQDAMAAGRFGLDD